ncbi:MAG: cyclic nucleotide-binding domain-containing protein [Defluviicoccus sp.]|nr:MAG: cyclic nucleotide-binding domain-containing protein [Defluviicoccus sp.]
MRYADAVALLRTIPVFASLDAASLKLLAFSSSYLTFHDGEMLCREGEAGDSVFVIEAGEVVISKSQDGQCIKVAQLGCRDLFGEMAVICNLPRTADVHARGTLKVLKIEGDVFLQLVTANPDAALGVMRVLSKRLMHFTRLYQSMQYAHPEDSYPQLPSAGG